MCLQVGDRLRPLHRFVCEAKNEKTSQSRFRFREGKCDVFVVVGQPPLATCEQTTAGCVPSVGEGSGTVVYKGLDEKGRCRNGKAVTQLVQRCRIVVHSDAVCLPDLSDSIAGKHRLHRSDLNIGATTWDWL
jgi:hypothetical protein